jgi:hypothetical protein
MPYTHFRYIAYQVPTVGQDSSGKAIYGIPAGTVVNPPALKGNVSGLDTDAQARVERLIGTMVAAKNRMKNLKIERPTALKVFTVPEFYFRPSQTDVSYTTDQYRAIKDVLRETISQDNRFSNWLVVIGTIMWAWEGNTTKRPTLKGQTVYLNTAVYIKGGETSDFSHTVEKAWASSIDGIPTGRHGGGFTADGNKLASSDTWWVGNVSKYQTTPKKEKHLFVAGGIRFGLDICLEHFFKLPDYSTTPPKPAIDSYRVAKNVVIQSQKDNVQLHLLIAGGMPINSNSVAAKKQGYILRNDGYVPSRPSTMTDCKQANDYSAIHTDQSGVSKNVEVGADNPYGVANLSTEIPLSSTIDIKNENQRLYINNPPNGNATFWDGHPQQIKIYESRDLP